MDRKAAAKAITSNTVEVSKHFEQTGKSFNPNNAEEIHQTKMAKLFDVDPALADALTDFYSISDTPKVVLDDILTPGYERGIKTLDMLGNLTEALGQHKRYVAVVRAIVSPVTGHGNAISWPAGHRVSQAWVRIFTDLTPDKFELRRGYQEVPTYGGTDTGLSAYKALLVNHPSHLFEGGRDSVGGSFEEQSSMFAWAGSASHVIDHIWTGEREEHEVEPLIFAADSALDLNDLLLAHGADETFRDGIFGAITLGDPAYGQWLLNESLRASA